MNLRFSFFGPSGLVGPQRVFPCPSDTSEDAVTLNLPRVFPSVDFETISWTQTGNAVFKADLVVNNCGCCPALHELRGWKNTVESQKIIPLKNGIYLLAPLAFGLSLREPSLPHTESVDIQKARALFFPKGDHYSCLGPTCEISSSNFQNYGQTGRSRTFVRCGFLH